VTREPIEDPADSRLDGYRFLREPARRRRIERNQEIFVAEGLVVLEALVSSPYRLRSALVSAGRADAAAALLAGVDAPLFVAPPEVLAEVAGFSVHRGVVALGERRPFPDPWQLVAATNLLVLVEGVNDHENLGALYRNAAAFGVGAVLLDPTTADPLYRRCLRVSMGHALRVPTARVPWPEALVRLRNEGSVVLALTPDPAAEDLPAVAGEIASRPPGDRPRRVALVVGAEGTGLSSEALAGAGRRVRIPMAGSVDSLNVATAAAVALYVVAPLVSGR
jgi:tRNA G18 (ribose-2'-O)-methylase SpoU